MYSSPTSELSRERNTVTIMTGEVGFESIIVEVSPEYESANVECQISCFISEFFDCEFERQEPLHDLPSDRERQENRPRHLRKSTSGEPDCKVRE